MCAGVSEVISSPARRVDHVCLFEEVVRGSVQCLCPDVFGVDWVEVEPQAVLSPLPYNGAVCVVFK